MKKPTLYQLFILIFSLAFMISSHAKCTAPEFNKWGANISEPTCQQRWAYKEMYRYISESHSDKVNFYQAQISKIDESYRAIQVWIDGVNAILDMKDIYESFEVKPGETNAGNFLKMISASTDLGLIASSYIPVKTPENLTVGVDVLNKILEALISSAEFEKTGITNTVVLKKITKATPSTVWLLILHGALDLAEIVTALSHTSDTYSNKNLLDEMAMAQYYLESYYLHGGLLVPTLEFFGASSPDQAIFMIASEHFRASGKFPYECLGLQGSPLLESCIKSTFDLLGYDIDRIKDYINDSINTIEVFSRRDLIQDTNLDLTMTAPEHMELEGSGNIHLRLSNTGFFAITDISFSEHTSLPRDYSFASSLPVIGTLNPGEVKDIDLEIIAPPVPSNGEIFVFLTGQLSIPSSDGGRIERRPSASQRMHAYTAPEIAALSVSPGAGLKFQVTRGDEYPANPPKSGIDLANHSNQSFTITGIVEKSPWIEHPWMAAVPRVSEIHPGDDDPGSEVDVLLLQKAYIYPAGTYRSNLDIIGHLSTGMFEGDDYLLATVPVTLEVSTPANLIFNGPELVNAIAKNGYSSIPSSIKIMIQNAGNSSVAWNASSDQSWLVPAALNGMIDGGSSSAVDVVLNVADLPLGTHVAKVVFTSPDVPNARFETLVSLSVSTDPATTPSIMVGLSDPDSELQSGHPVKLVWATENASPSDQIALSMKRDSASGLSEPDGVNWIRFTDGTDNDGAATVIIPTNATAASDWRFYARHVPSGIYNASRAISVFHDPAGKACGVDWQWVNPLPQGNPLRSVAYGNGQYVAVGDAGTVLISPDGVTWTPRDSGTTETLSDITWNGNLFVAIGGVGTILTSSDGDAWTPVNSGTSQYLSSVIWNGDQFVAVGRTILTSPDGVVWTTQSSGTTASLYGVAWDGSQFVAVGSSGTVLTSADGAVWTKRSSGTTVSLYGIAWGGSQFVAVGGSGTVLTSADGSVWTSLIPRTTQTLQDVTWDGSQFLIIGKWGTILKSGDGLVWKPSSLPSNSIGSAIDLSAVIWGSDQIVVVGSGGAVFTSPDGISHNWTARIASATDVRKSLLDVTRGGGQFVAVGAGGELLTSPNGLDWTSRETGWANPFHDVTWGDDRYVVSTEINLMFTSSDGVAWTDRIRDFPGVSNRINGVIWGISQFVAVGNTGTILTSPDGLTWSARISGTTNHLYDVTWDGEHFVAVGSSGTILSSPNGITWTTHASGTTNGLGAVTWGEDRFVAVGSEGEILSSPDGFNWATETSGVTSQLYDVVWGANRFVVVGYGGKILTSSDAENWTLEKSGTGNDLRGVAWGANRFVVVGSDGTILTSACGDAVTAPTVTTAAASDISASEATLNGIVNDNGAETTASFDYGVTANYGSTVSIPDVLSAGAGNTALAATISGLTCGGGRYYYRIKAINSAGTTIGSNGSFTTTACQLPPPTATTTFATDVSASGAILNGTVNDNGASTTVSFEYGLTSSYGSTVTATPGTLDAGTGSTSVTATLSGLACSRLYYYRVKAVNTAGTAHGSEQAFWTSDCPAGAPTVITTAPSGITATGATLNGIVNANNAGADVSFEIGQTTDYGFEISPLNGWVPAGAGSTPASLNLTGLGCNNTYHYRARASNAIGTTHGDDISFTTLACPGASYPLTVTKTGDGQGNVRTRVPSVGINCGSDCSVTYPVDTLNLLEATAAADSTFVGWTGACSGTKSTCSVKMTAAKNVTATFRANDISCTDDWQWANPVPQGNSLRGIAYGDGAFVAVGGAGTLIRSTDGLSWTNHHSGKPYSINSVVWGGGQFVAVGDDFNWDGSYSYGPTPILTSPDGVTWTERDTGTRKGLYGLAWNGNQFVAVGSNAILTSPDGMNWTARSPGGTDSQLNDVTWNGTQFVAVGSGGAILTSLDGATWTTRHSGTSMWLNGITWDDHQFVAVGENATILTSPDGVTWTTRELPPEFWLTSLFGVAWDGSQFVTAGTGLGDHIFTSPDGVTWTSRSSAGTGVFYDVSWSGSQFVAVGWNGRIATSSDAINWTERAFGATQDVHDVTWGGSQFAAVGAAGTIMTSPDGMSWTERSSGTSDSLFGVAWGTDRFVSVGESGKILTSPDGVLWTGRSSGAGPLLYDVTWSGNQFVSVGSGGTIVTSPDGIDWTQRVSGTTETLKGVASDGNRLIAVGHGSDSESGIMLTSQDGVTWISGSSAMTDLLAGIVWGGNQFVVVGGPKIFTSPDGVTWTQRLSGTNENLLGVMWDGSQYSAVGTSGLVLTSPDGMTWTPGDVMTVNHLSAAVAHEGRGVVVGHAGVILTNRCGSDITAPVVTTRAANNVTTSEARLNGTVDDKGLTASVSFEYGQTAGYGATAVATPASIVAGSGSTAVIANLSGLVCGATYHYRVKAVNSAGTAYGNGFSFITSACSPTTHSLTVSKSGSGQGTVVSGDSPPTIDCGSDCTKTYPANTMVTLTATAASGTIFTGWRGDCAGSESSCVVTMNDTKSVTALFEEDDGLTCGVDWQWASPLPQGNDLSHVVYGNDQFVAVGKNGAIVTSPDGGTWTARKSGIIKNLLGVTWGDDRFVAVGDYGTILTSLDGQTWTELGTYYSENLRSITWGGDQFVAVGDGGTILTSPDGDFWTKHTSDGWFAHLRSVTWGDGQFVTVGENGAILTSPDGHVWTVQTSGTGSDLSGVTWGGDQFIAVGYDGAILTSPDGHAWTAQTSGTGSDLLGVTSVTWGNYQFWGDYRFIAVGEGEFSSTILTSPDGRVWTERWSPRDGLSGVTWGGDQFVTVGRNGVLLNSPHGSYWTEQTSVITTSLAPLSYVTWGGDQFVALSEGGAILTSPDGRVWTVQTWWTGAYLSGVTWGGDQFVAVGYDGTILTSPDGRVWTAQTSGTGSHLSGVTWGGDQFVAVGQNGAILTSPDGHVWTVQTSGTGVYLSGVTWGGDQFVAIGYGGESLTSPDGRFWTQDSIGLDGFLWVDVTWGGDQFVAVGNHFGDNGYDGAIMTSPDGRVWTAQMSGTNSTLESVTWGGDQFVTVGYDGTILTSPDGRVWTARGKNSSLHSVTWGGDQFVAVGGVYSQTILVSRCTAGGSPSYPTVTTNAATGINAAGATLNGTVKDNGASTTVSFEYGLTNSYGSTVAATPDTLSAGTGTTAVATSLSGLTCNRTYHYRVKATNSAGTTNGSDLSFTTTACPATAPSATTSAATGITASGATLNGTVNGNGASTTVSFEYGLTASYGNSVAATPATLSIGTGNTAVAAPISDLTCNRSYHYRVKAANSAGTTRGSDLSFVTSSCPAVADIHVSPTSGLATTENGGTATFSVVLTSQPSADVSVTLTSSDPSEGTVAPTLLTFTPANWEQAQTVVVTGANDALADGDQIYSVVLAAAVSADARYNGLNPADVSVTNRDNDYRVTPSAGANGRIEPDSVQAVEGGASMSFTVTPDDGYGVSVDGTCGGSLSGAVYITHAIVADCTVAASFTKTNTTTTITSVNPSPSKIGEAVTLNYAVTNSGTSEDMVTVTAQDGTTCNGTVTAGGCTLAFTTAGAKTLIARYTGSNGAQNSASAGTNHLVADAPSLATPSLNSGVVGVPYAMQLVASGGVAPYAFSATSLPTSFTLSSSGLLAGTGSAAETSNVAITVTDALNQTATVTKPLTLVSQVTVVTTSLPDGLVNAPYVQNLEAIGGQTPYVWTLASGSLPAGLKLDPTSGELSGTPTALGIGTSFTVQVRDAANRTATQALPLTTHAPTVVETGTVGGVPVTVSGNLTPIDGGITCALDDQQTLVLNLGDGGVPGTAPAGTNLTYGLFKFSMQGCTPGATQLNVRLAYPAALPVGTRYWKYGQTADNPTPHWYVLPTAVIEGNTVSFTITDGGFGDDDLSANGSITDPGGPSEPVIRIGGAPGNGQVGSFYSAMLTAINGFGPNYVWSLASGGLPPGVGLNAVTGVLNGTPTQAGTFNFSVQLVDTGNGNVSTTRAFGVTIAAAGGGGGGPVPIDGACGNADGQILTKMPSGAALCASGTASAVTGNGPWTWSCLGSNGGSTASCRANLATATTYTITTSASTGGTISPPSRVVNQGETTTFTLIPATGYAISSASGCGGTLNGNTYTTGVITGACVVSATFSPRQYTVTATASSGGTIAPANRRISHGIKANFTVTPAADYRIETVSGCGGILNGSLYTTAPITTDCAIAARFTAMEPTPMGLVGDWDGDGTTTAGLFDPVSSTFYLRNTNTSGQPNAIFRYGPQNAGWWPLAGDWNGDGVMTVGLYDPASGTFYLRNSHTPGLADVTFRYGPQQSGWYPLAGDWDGDGIDTVGLYAPQPAVFFLRNTNTPGVADQQFRYGPEDTDWLPLVGDWNGDGTTAIGLYDGESGRVYLRHTNTPGVADITFRYGPLENDWQPLGGDWSGDGADTIGLFNPATRRFYMRDSNTAGMAEHPDEGGFLVTAP